MNELPCVLKKDKFIRRRSDKSKGQGQSKRPKQEAKAKAKGKGQGQSKRPKQEGREECGKELLPVR